MNDNFNKIVLIGILVCLLVIAFKQPDTRVYPQNTSNPQNININSDITGKQIVQLAPNRIAVIDSSRQSRTVGTVLVFDYSDETKKFEYTSSMNYSDYFNNPDKFGISTNPTPISVPLPTTKATFRPYSTVRSEVSISAGDKKIEYVSSNNVWGGKIYDREDAFNKILKSSGYDIPTIDNGKVILLNFDGDIPNQIAVTEFLLDKDGNQLTTDNKSIIPVKLNEKQWSYEIKQLDDNSVAYRGIRIIATWGENQYAYSFVIKKEAN